MPRFTPPRRELERVDVAAGNTGGLPPSLLDAIEAEGGLWYASDYYTRPAEIVARAHEVGAVALRLDARDLSLLHERDVLDSIPGLVAIGRGKNFEQPVPGSTAMASSSMRSDGCPRRGSIDGTRGSSRRARVGAEPRRLPG